MYYNWDMSFEKREAQSLPSIYDINISEGWDTQSQLEIFFKTLKKLPFYRSGLLYSGFDANQIGKSFGSTEEPGLIFCSPEEAIGSQWDETRDPWQYALEYNQPAIAVYNPKKLKREGGGLSDAYRSKSSSSLLAVIRIK